MSLNRLVLVLFLLFFSCFSFEALAKPSHYLVTLKSLSADFIEVEAEINIESGRLSKTPGGSYDWPTGWAEFITIDQVLDEKGTPLEVTEKSEGTSSYEGDNFYWLVQQNGAPYQGPARVKYRVSTTYIKTDWDFGNEQAGKIIDGNLYTVTHPLFLNSGPVEEWTVIFQLPDGFGSTTPWESARGKINQYQGKGSSSLQENSIIIGVQSPLEITVGGFDFRLMLLGNTPSLNADLEPLIGNLTRFYRGMFPQTPSGPYLLTIFPARVEDGESFTNSTALTTTGVLNTGAKNIWANFIAHEFFHFWNGQQIYGDPYDDLAWFSEGVTDYFATLALLNSEVMAKPDFLREAEQILGNYLYFIHSPNFDGVTVKDAGASSGKNRFGVYDAGWAIALALDLKIHQETGGRFSLKDAMGKLYENFGLSGEPFTYDDLVAVLNDLTGQDQSPFFEKYVFQRNPLDLDEILPSLGLEILAIPYADRAIISPLSQTNQEQTDTWLWLSSGYFE